MMIRADISPTSTRTAEWAAPEGAARTTTNVPASREARSRPTTHFRNRSSLTAGKSLDEISLDAFDGDAFLRHGVAVADGDGVVFKGVEVDRDAVRRADLVLPPVALA